MEVEKKKDGAFWIRYVITWIILFYAGVASFLISPVVLVFLFSFTLPVIIFHSKSRILVMTVFARLTNLQFVTCMRIIGAKVMISGDNLEKLVDCRALVLPNHLNIFDHFIFMTAAESFGIKAFGRWIFVIYNMWIYTPLGLVWGTYGNYFVNTVHSSKREMVLRNIREHFDKIYYERDLRWVCLYPEGSRLFLLKKGNAKFEKDNNLPTLTNCAYPRLGAALSALKVLGPDPKNPEKSNNGRGPPLKYLVDVTLGYPNKAQGSVFDIFYNSLLYGNEGPFAIHYETFDMDPKWSEEEELRKFLFDRYQKKDKLLEDYYKTGSFSKNAKEAPMPSDLLIVSVQLFQFVVFAALVRLVLSFFI
uniref:PlsC domain-containing protein n=1 Tax=Caenorhabditis japonica TaxID=281687 RepID=A0A8R1DSP6_CAEJA